MMGIRGVTGFCYILQEKSLMAKILLAEAGEECAEKTNVRDAGRDGEVCFGQSRGN